jgi:hypothetical protein
MTISVQVLEIMLYTATGLAAIAPLVLFLLWIRDRKEGNLW